MGRPPPYFARLERGHLPVICLGKTRRNMGINNILIPIFGLAFYRETKWPNVVSEIDFGSRFRTHFGARRNVWAFENVKTLPKQGPEQELVSAVIFFSFFRPKTLQKTSKRFNNCSKRSPKDRKNNCRQRAGAGGYFFSENKQIGPKKDLKRERESERERER